ncbi:MAG: rhodanese-like domain-containing protein [Oligoflexia bacterium]|nr:rhodanese-like domain-containing protein [Oligoflexia bacterium]
MKILRKIGFILILAIVAMIVFTFIFSPAQAQPVTIPIGKAPKYPPKKKQFKTPVVLDARPAFKYAMGHLNLAQPIRWEDYSQTEEQHKGALDPDYGLLARKLRLLGVKPDREVIVLGDGAQGIGEEGRIGWMLLYLGVKKVQVFNVDYMKGKKLFGERLDVDEAPLWTPKINALIKIEKRELAVFVKEKKSDKVIIDVRTAEEFNGKKTLNEKRPGHIPGAINITWTKFLNDSGNISDADNLVKLLKEHKVNTNSELVFYCSNGVRSAHVAFGALKAGLSARLYDGSFMQWSADDQMPVDI